MFILPHSVPSTLYFTTYTTPKLPPNIYEFDPSDTAPSHHTYLSFFFLEQGFTRLIFAGLRAGRSLKRFNLAPGNCMVDPRLLTNTSSLPPISTMLKKSMNYNPAQKPSLIQCCWLATMWVQCQSDRCSKFSVLFWVCCCKTALRLGAVWRVIVSRVELDQECRREWQLSEHQHFIHTCPLPNQRGHTLWAIQSGSN